MATDMKHMADGEQASVIYFSKFRYKLEDFFAEVRVLRDKEESSRIERVSITEDYKAIELERQKKIEALQLELAEAVDVHHTLENTVKVIRQELSTMEDKYKSVNLELKSVLQSRNSLAEELKASKYDLECRLADKSCELALIKEKLGRHASLFEVFEREASDVQRAVDETCQLVSSKEEQTTQLENQVQILFSFERKLTDRIRFLEEDKQKTQNMILMKEKEILSLKRTLESLKFQLENVMEKTEITETLEMKEALISEMSMQNKELLTEIENVTTVNRKLQNTLICQEETVDQLKKESAHHHKFILELQEKLKQADAMHSEFRQDKHKMVMAQNEELCRHQAKEKNWRNEKATMELKIKEFSQLINNFDGSKSKTVVVEKSTSLDGFTFCSEAATSTEDLNKYLDSAKDSQTMKETRNEPHCSNKRVFYASETCITDGIPIQTSSEDKDPAAFLGNETTEFKMVQQDNEILETSQTFPGSNLSSYNGSIPFIDIEELSTTVLGLSNQVPGHFEVTSASMTDSNFKVLANNQSLLENCDMHMGTDGEQSVQKLSCSEQIKIPNVSKFDYRTMLQEKTDSLLLGNEKSMETGRNLNQQSSIQDDTKASLRMLNSIMFRLGRPLPQSQADLPDSSNLPSICHTIIPQEGNGVSGQHFSRMSSSKNGLEEEEKLRVPKEDTTNKSETFLENLQESDCTSTSIEQNKSYTRKSEITDNRWPIARTKPNKICDTPDDTSNKNTEDLNESISPRVSSQKDDAASITSSVDAIVQATKPEGFLENMSMPITDRDKATQLQSTAEEASSVVAASVDFSTAWNAAMTRPECLELSHGCLTPQASQISSPEEVLAAKSVEEKLPINEVANQVMEKENDVSLLNQQHTKISLSATACICYNPPFGYMVSCETCRMQFHAGCISWKSTNSGYVCDECKTKPRKRRRRNT